jgi:hypothetical protein
MREPQNKPAAATHIYFNKAGLPDGVALVHKLTNGHFDLQFAEMGDKLPEMRARYAEKLPGDMKIVRTNKSASIRLLVSAQATIQNVPGASAPKQRQPLAF